MSFRRNSQQPDDHWEFTLVRDVYRQGTPVDDVEMWVKRRIAKCRASEMRRFHTDWEKFKLDTMTEATRLRKEARSRATGAVTIHVMPLVPILFEDIDTQIEKDLPPGWDPDLTRIKILEALQFIDDKSLTPGETKAFHLVHVIRYSSPTGACSTRTAVAPGIARGHHCFALRTGRREPSDTAA